MKSIKNINSKDIIAIDIESVRYTNTFEELEEKWQSAWEYKNKQDGEIPDFETLSDLWQRNSSLYAEFSKVCAISLAFLDRTGENLMVKEFAGEDEYTLLNDFAGFTERIEASSGDFRLIGHASKFYDYPFLAKRLIINNIKIPNMLDSSNHKPWEGKNLCTNELWRSFGTGAGSSLQALCTVLGVPTSKVDLVGDEVGTAYFKGEISRIKDYCTLDTVATFNVFRRLKNESLFGFDEFKVIGKELKVEKLPVLERLRNLGEITDEVEEEIKELLSKKKVLKKDIKYIEKILKAALFREDFISGDQDETAVRKQKKEDIKQFIESL